MAKNTMDTYEEITAMIAERGENTNHQYVLEALHVIANNAAGDIRDGQRVMLMTGILNDLFGPIAGPGDVASYWPGAPRETL